MAKEEEKTVTAGQWELSVLTLGSRSVVRLPNGYALTLGAKKPELAALLEKVAAGGYDDYIAQHCKGGR